MNEFTNNRFSPSANLEIDIFLDGALEESERDRIEKLCLEDSRFFARVQRREQLRSQLAALRQGQGDPSIPREK